MKQATKMNRFTYLFVFFILFTSVDTILFGTNSVRLLNYIPRLAAVIGIIYFSYIGIKRLCGCKGLLIFTSMVLIVIMSLLVNQSDLGSIISRLLFILLAYVMSVSLGYKLFFKIYDDFMYLVSIFAILLEVVAYLFPSLLNFSFIIINEAGTVYRSFFVASVMDSFIGSSYIRISGIFWEPGAYSVYLVLALISQLFILERINLKRLILFIISLFLTFSTTGIVSFIVLIPAYFFSNYTKLKRKVNLAFTFIILILLILMLLLFGMDLPFFDIFFSKITNNNSSARTRWASLIVPFYIAIDYPLLGVGPNNVLEFMRTYASHSTLSLQASNMLTNTTTYQFATYGFIFGLLFLTSTFFSIKTIVKNNLFCSLFVFLSLLLAYFGENFFSFFPYLILFIGIVKDYKGGDEFENCCY